MITGLTDKLKYYLGVTKLISILIINNILETIRYGQLFVFNLSNS